jgi:hypothetical protein
MIEARPPLAFDRTNLKPLAVGLLAGFGFFLVACSVASLCVAFSSGEPLKGRLLMIAMAAVSFFLPGWFALASLRLKWTTGRWTISPEERRARQNRYAANKPSPMVRLVSSPAFRIITNGIMIVLAVANIWLQLRQGLHAFEFVLVVVWSAVAALSIWQLLPKSRVAAKS